MSNSKMHQIEIANKTQTVYLCYDENEIVCFGSIDKEKAEKYARKNNCKTSSYPPNCLEINSTY